MKGKKLQNYIDSIYNLEKNQRILYDSLKIMKKEVSIAGKPHSIQKPVYRKPNYDNGREKDILLMIVSLIIILLCLFCLYLTLFYNYWELNENAGLIMWLLVTIFSWFPDVSDLKILFAVIECFFMIRVGIFLFLSSFGEAGDKKYNNNLKQQADEEYKHDMESYEKYVLNDRERVSKELENLPILKSDISKLESQLLDNKKTLKSLYDLNIIYSKYRTFEAVTQFLEYLKSGRCSELEGTYGCYNLYEDELKAGTIISNLASINNKMDSVLKNQRELYDAVVEIGNKVNSICKEVSLSNENIEQKLDVIASHQEIDLYCNELSAYNTAVMKNYIIMRDIYR